MAELEDNEPVVKPVESPCIGFCILDEYGYCGGCHRTMVEILAWPDMSEAQKLHVLEQVARRKTQKESAKDPQKDPQKDPFRPKG